MSRLAGPHDSIPDPDAPIHVASEDAHDSRKHVLLVGPLRRVFSCHPRDSVATLWAYVRLTASTSSLNIRNLKIYQDDKVIPHEGAIGDLCNGRPFDAHPSDADLTYSDWTNPQDDPDRMVINLRCATVNRNRYCEVHLKAPIATLREKILSFPFPKGPPTDVVAYIGPSFDVVNLCNKDNISSLNLHPQTTLNIVPYYKSDSDSEDDEWGDACPLPVDPSSQTGHVPSGSSSSAWFSLTRGV